jgi:ATP-dependent exoDNAse (exonuclease V) alpha subunit
MVRRLTQDGDGVGIVVGPAGCGKTLALAAAREAWEASGRRIYGAAVARRAAHELEDGAGIPSTSVAALLTALERHPLSTLRLRSVLVIDEAGMLPTRELARSSSARARSTSSSCSSATIASSQRSAPAARSAH